MRMNELTEQERCFLDKLNSLILPIVKDETQSLWNVCWGYLNKKFNESILDKPDDEIREILKDINKIAPKIVKETDVQKPKTSINKSVKKQITKQNSALF